jgi:hypothetical protein
MMRRIRKMRSFRSMRFLWAVGGTVLLLGLVLPGQALAQTFNQYTATATISKITAENSASLPKLTAAGIAVGSAVTSTILIDPNTPDATPADTGRGTYLTRWVSQLGEISFSLGDGPQTFDVSCMERDHGMAVANEQPADANVPFPYDAYGWGGSEPLNTQGPSFLALDPGTEAEPKGTAVFVVGGWVMLADDSMPDPLPAWGSSLIRLLYMDLLDTQLADAKITIEAGISGVTLTKVPVPLPSCTSNLPTMNRWAAGVLLLAMLAGGAVLATRRLRAES